MSADYNQIIESLVGSEICFCNGCEVVKDSVIDYRCDQCGYIGRAGTLECCCYEDWARDCTPKGPGPGCPHGTVVCPLCVDGHRSVADLASALVENLKKSRPNQEGK